MKDIKKMIESIENEIKEISKKHDKNFDFLKEEYEKMKREYDLMFQSYWMKDEEGE